MEHRDNKRLPATVDVMVCDEHKLPAIHFKTDNVGVGGLFIKTASEPYSIGALLDILFELEVSRRHKKPHRHHISARIVHSSEKGIGVKFLEASHETTLAWQLIVYRACECQLNTKMG